MSRHAGRFPSALEKPWKTLPLSGRVARSEIVRIALRRQRSHVRILPGALSATPIGTGGSVPEADEGDVIYTNDALAAPAVSSASSGKPVRM